MVRIVIDMQAASRNGLGIVGRRIIDKKFSSKKEAMKYVCNNYYNIKFNKITSCNVLILMSNSVSQKLTVI